MDAVLALVDKTDGRSKVPFFVAVSVELSGRLMSISLAVKMPERHTASSFLIKCDEAPLSLFAMITFFRGRNVVLIV